MDAKKQKVIDVMKSNFGNITMACEAVGITRTTFYRWKTEDPEFKEIAENIDEYLVDFAEHSLFKQIREGNTAATIFFLKTKGKGRGYIEKQEIEHTGVINKIELGSGIKPDDEEGGEDE